MQHGESWHDERKATDDEMPKAKTKRKASRKPGAQPGNKNAEKHGFYSQRFSSDETKRLEGTERNTIESEIDLLRVCLDRLATQLDFDPVYLKDKEGGDLDLRDDHYLKQLNTLGLMTQSLSTLIRTDFLTKGKGGKVEQGIMEALEELRIEMGL
jgi:hypothetical protein